MEGVRASRVVHPPAQCIDGHRHHAACLTLHVVGGYTEVHEAGDQLIVGPAAVLHPPGRWHANRIAAGGLETVSIVFDPMLLRASVGPRLLDEGSRTWIGGSAAARARRLAALWTHPGAPEAILVRALADFLGITLQERDAPPTPEWLTQVRRALDSPSPPSTFALSSALDLHPAWLARAYRAATGEGLQETLRRKRVERAALLLRRTGISLAQIAVEVGFCDQSHMTRVFGLILGRTPLEVRAEAKRVTIVGSGGLCQTKLGAA